MDRYEARMNLRGDTQRERTKNRTLMNLQDKMKNSLSYKIVKLNGVKTNLVIDSGTQPYYKEFKSMPNQDINIGDYVEWANSVWLVTTCDFDDELYRDGKLTQCNYLLKWQNEHGKIIERWAVIMSASKYNDGTDGNNVLTLGSDQLSIAIPLDQESIKLKKSMSKKFFIDNNRFDPTTYELTGTGNVTDTYNGRGITSWIVKECAYTASEDDLKYGVCDYRPPKDYIIPNSSTNESTDLRAKIISNGDLRVGYFRTYTVWFTDKNENTVDWNDVNFTWNIKSDFNVEKTIDGNKIKLKVTDDSLIGESFLLQCMVGTSVITEIKVIVCELM